MANPLSDLIIRKVLVVDKSQVKLMNKVDFVMFPAKAYAKMVQKLGDDLGDEWLFDYGFKYGTVVAQEFKANFDWIGKALMRRLSTVQTMFTVMGFGKMEMKKWDYDNHIMCIHINNHPTIEWATKLFGKKEKSCIVYRGIFSAHANEEFGIQNCKFTETQCRSKGDPYCEWSFNYFKKKKLK